MKKGPSSNIGSNLVKSLVLMTVFSGVQIAIPNSVMAVEADMASWSHEKQGKALVLINNLFLLKNEIQQKVELRYPIEDQTKWHPGIRARKGYKNLTKDQIQQKQKELKRAEQQLSNLIGEDDLYISSETRNTLATLLGNIQIPTQRSNALGSPVIKRRKKEAITLEHADNSTTEYFQNLGTSDGESTTSRLKPSPKPISVAQPEPTQEPIEEMIEDHIKSLTEKLPQAYKNMGVVVGGTQKKPTLKFPFNLLNGSRLILPYGLVTAKSFSSKAIQNGVDSKIKFPKGEIGHYIFDLNQNKLYVFSNGKHVKTWELKSINQESDD